MDGASLPKDERQDAEPELDLSSLTLEQHQQSQQEQNPIASSSSPSTISSDNSQQQQDSTTRTSEQQSEKDQQLQQADASQQSSSSATSSSSSSTSSSIGSATNSRTITNQATTTSNTATTDNKSDLSSMPEDLFSNKRWGTTPIRQDTPWELPPSPTQTQSSATGQSQPIQQHQPSAVSTIGSRVGTGVSGSPLAIPPGISQSGDSFHSQAMAAVSNLGLVGASGQNVGVVLSGGNGAARFDQPWRPIASKPQPPLSTSASFANHSLISPTSGAPQKSLLNNFGNGGQQGFGAGSGAIGSGFQAQADFARAPGPVTSNILNPKPFGGIGQRASTWSSFGTPSGPNDPDSEWPKTTNSGISGGQTPSNAYDLVHDFEPGKSWHNSNLMKGLEDDSPLSNLGASMSSAFQNTYGFSSSGASKSPTGSQYEGSGIGTWSPIVKGGRSGSMWDGDGADARGDNGRFDDGTAIWGNPTSTKTTGAEWGEKGGDPANPYDKSRSSGMGNQANYRPQQQQSSSTSSASLIMSSNTSPSGQHGRNPSTAMNKAPSQNFNQVQQQSNALSSQANQPNRGLGLPQNVPSKHQQQLTTMVQQIQLAVQAGHLNPQILNQPLAPITLQLLYQLLTQIRSLQQLQMKFNQPGQHQAAVGVQMTKTKQNIMNLQNQIAAQQAMHLKQQTQAHNISSRQPTMSNLATGGVGSGNIGPQQTQAHNISNRQTTLPNLATGGVGSGNLGPTLPPGISQSGDSFRSVGDLHSGQAIVNSFGVDSMSANGLASSLGHMSATRFDQPWRASGNGGSSFGMPQVGGEFARAPGPASLTPKSAFGMTSTSSTWSAFGNSSSNEPESEWPKTTTTSNAFDLAPEFEPGKPWRGSMLMRSVEDDPTMTPASMAQRKIWSDEIL